jgi:hypothetical protein
MKYSPEYTKLNNIGDTLVDRINCISTGRLSVAFLFQTGIICDFYGVDTIVMI